MPTNELKPCPFCGGEIQKRGLLGDEKLFVIHKYECYFARACPCFILEYADGTKEILTELTPSCGIGERFETEAEAIEAWNTRAERTCRNVAVEGVLFECSECGAKTVDAVGNYTQEYCAACGRRVQDAD